MTLSYVKHEKVWLKDHPQSRETWLRDRIVVDPAILGLGDLDVKDAERTQPRAAASIGFFPPVRDRRWLGAPSHGMTGILQMRASQWQGYRYEDQAMRSW